MFFVVTVPTVIVPTPAVNAESVAYWIMYPVALGTAFHATLIDVPLAADAVGADGFVNFSECNVADFAVL